MRQIGAFEAKNRLSELLVAVENGAEVTITKHGRPVAKLVPFIANDPARIAAAIAELRELRDKVRLGTGETVRQLIDAGRRD
ncbi:MAG: type II toxin-antitoxin system prevent-host-death family antitoxin [Steroidobacteraceae bacterium]|nr:type II toxin-antitoxin system prevent-host-death family antitoxin [Steroidobacteraceae bacterium]